MMLRIGNKSAFTLIEVMAATTVLVVGVVFIYESFFISLDSFAYSSDVLNISPWASEKVWEIQDNIRTYGFLAHIDKRGKITKKNRDFYWTASCNLVNEAKDMDLYNIDLTVSWNVGTKKLKLSRSAYATYEYEEDDVNDLE